MEAHDARPGDRGVMDDEALRAALQTMVASEVRTYLTTYRGAGTAELSKVGAELKSEMNRIANELRKERQEIEAAFAVPRVKSITSSVRGAGPFSPAL